MIGGTYDLGNAQINAPGTYQFNLKSIPEQCVVKWLNMAITCAPYASGAYSFKNAAPVLLVETTNTAAAAQGDDVDTVLSAIITSMDFIVGPAFSCFSAMSLPRLRTALAYITGQDFIAPANGTAIAHSGGTGTTLNFNIILPLGLPGLLPDLSIMDQGALRFQAAGQLNINYGAVTAAAFTGTFADGSTTFTIPTATTVIRMNARTQNISTGAATCGALWQLTFGSGAVTTGQTKPAIHLGLFDQTSQPENTGSGAVATGYNVQNGTTSLAQNASPSQLDNNFSSDRVQGTFVNPVARGVPMMYYPQVDTVSQVDQTGSAVNYQVTGTGFSSLALLELVAIPPGAAELQDVAQRVGGGGSVAIDQGVAKSMNGKRPSSPAVKALLPILIYPAASAPAGLPVTTPAGVASAVSSMIAQNISAAKAAQPYGKAGQKLVSPGGK
jgi:hypothetical protein